MGVLEDKMRVALASLVKSHPLVFSAIAELRAQNFTAEADNLQAALDTLIAETDAAQLAVAS